MEMSMDLKGIYKFFNKHLLLKASTNLKYKRKLLYTALYSWPGMYKAEVIISSIIDNLNLSYYFFFHTFYQVN